MVSSHWDLVPELENRIQINSVTGHLRFCSEPLLSLPESVSLYLVRHGETKANQMLVFQGSDKETELTRLSETGHAQSREAASLLTKHIQVNHPGQPVFVGSSPAQRSLQTVQYFLDAAENLFKLQFQVLKGLNEIKFGDMTGKTLDEICKMSPAHAKFIEEYRRQGNALVSAGGSENFIQVLQRVYKGLTEWLPTRDSKSGPSVWVVFTHMITAGAVRTTLGDKQIVENHSEYGAFVRWRQVIKNAEPYGWRKELGAFEKL